MIKGSAGVIGLTDKISAMSRWLLCAPEISSIIDEFESKNFCITSESQYYQHHTETLAEQQRVQQRVKALINVIDELGNPFEEMHADLLTLDTRDCTNVSVIKSLDNLQSHGTENYDNFKETRLLSNASTIHEPITRNKFPLFKERKKRTPSSQKKTFVNNIALFGRMYIANQHRQGDPLVFFSHENQLDPPSIADDGKLRKGDKTKLLQCIGERHTPVGESGEPLFDCQVIDGGTLLNILPTTGVSTFQEFATRIFMGHVKYLLKNISRLDIVCDQYNERSIKSGTRAARGSGNRRKVAPKTRLPTEQFNSWRKFLRDSENKVELINYLNKVAEESLGMPGKVLILTSGVNVLSIGSNLNIDSCSIEEADARIIVHLINAAEHGFEKLCIRTVDSDVIYIVIGHLEKLLSIKRTITVTVAFGTGNHYRILNINEMALSLSPEMQTGFTVFHAFTGCDTASFFFRKGKTTFWKKLKAYPDALNAFVDIANNPFTPMNIESENFKILERFVIVVYESESNAEDVNRCRLQLFAKKSQDLNNCPPTKDALLQHTKRAIYQAGIWCMAHDVKFDAHSPGDWGWVIENDDWNPLWITQEPAAEACRELYRCKCKSKQCSRCICHEINLQCTYLCDCSCQLQQP